jgi:serine/threonine protein kinase
MNRVVAGKYEVLGTLGEGCSGKVYLVRHTELDIRYAMKILDASVSHNEAFIERFKREAAALELFMHPGSVRLRDFGRTEDDQYYMTMDYCPGELLRTLLSREGRFSVQECLDIVIQILDALEAAHRVNVVHRDIKPENIMIEEGPDRKRTSRILDFGIAKIHRELRSDLTVVGDSVGTPQYMSPEQANGDEGIDHRADLYSVGILMYELLSGKVPFLGKNVVQTLLMQVMRDPDPFEPSIEVPSIVQDIVFRALKKDPAERYQTAADFRSACAMAISAKVRSPGVSPAVASKLTVSDDSKQTILYLDDDEVLLNIVKFMLESQGYHAITTANPSLVHTYLFEGNVDLLLTDVNMPGIPGTKVCSMIKETLPTLKIILFSNLDERELAKSCNSCNADAWISKNWKPDVWLATIRDMIAHSIDGDSPTVC